MKKIVAQQFNWYDHPKYYDIAFQTTTTKEADFIEDVLRKYCQHTVNSLLEPACGSGRMIVELAQRGYEMHGYDSNRAALRFLWRRLSMRHLHAYAFIANMSDFKSGLLVDSAFCLANSFRHLLTENDAISHLQCVAEGLRRGAVYLIGMSIPPYDRSLWDWSERRGNTKVTVSQTVLSTLKRVETSQLKLVAQTGCKEFVIEHKVCFRNYSRAQFTKLIESVPSFELCDTYDWEYDINKPLSNGAKIEYGLFVLRKK